MRLPFYRTIRTTTLYILSLAIITGCVSAHKEPEFEQLTQLPRNVCKVAVIPFLNDSEYPQGDIIFYRIFLTELIKKQEHLVAQEGDVRKIFRQMRISPKDETTLDQMLVIADRLSVDAVISGTIVKMEEKKGQKVTEPKIAVDLRLIDAYSGKTMLTTYHTRVGEDYRKIMHFGLVNTITELSSLVSREILDTWKDKGLTQCQK